tara:strand:+ start:202 stop:411 length:210 start_codon:yes stop_codon:yes gene_type:complete
MNNSPKKPQISYSKIKTSFEDNKDRHGKPIPVTLYCFYPDGTWDESKHTKHEAETLYPRSKYTWKLIKD